MAGRRHTPDEIVEKLREAETHLAEGNTVADVCRKFGISEQTFYRWRNDFGKAQPDGTPPKTERIRALETENERLKEAVVDLVLQIQAYKQSNGK